MIAALAAPVVVAGAAATPNAVAPTSETTETIALGKASKTMKGLLAKEEGSLGGLKRAEGSESAESGQDVIPAEHLMEITSITGGGAGTADDASDLEEKSSPEIAPGDPAHLVADRAEHADPAAKIEARSLDRGERTRIVHEVIDRVSKHVETLAIQRSRDPLTIQLEPAELGRIVVEVSREANGLSADLSASDPRVAQALDRHRSELVAGLAARGHAEARVTVQATTGTETPGFDLRRDPGQTPQQQHSQHHHAPSRGASLHDSAASLTHAAQRPRLRLRATGLDLEI
ncbi:flagellar hook-length control protein FliK [bacterium]|nr:MAG: flagellar hook-length control protein FliK [bacterium]